jgi:Biotin/lipoate A/B protein ligase family
MGAVAHSDSRGMHHAPLMPPGLALVTLRERGDAFAHAQAIAAEAGAGTLVWTRRFDLLELAVVLEPPEALKDARLAHYLGMNAAADCLAAICPPEKPLLFEWPGAILIDGGLLGGGRTAWPEGTAEDSPPDWLVFGFMVRTATLRLSEPGLAAVGVSMEDEGFGDFDTVDLVEAFARHLMLGVDEWQTRGRKTVVRRFVDRLTPREGSTLAIERTGALRIVTGGEERLEPLVPALAEAAWFDPIAGEPKL